jgi:proline racemase
MRVTTLEAHVGGAAVRLVTSGLPAVEGSTMAERQQSFDDCSEGLALRLTREPRGHAGMVGVVLTPPAREQAVAGMLFFDGFGSRAHSGHAAMAAVALALEHGLATIGGRGLEIDTVAGACRVDVLSSRPGGACRVRYQGPPTAVLRANLAIPSTRRGLAADLVWSGTELVAIVDGEAAGVPLATTHTLELRRAARDLIATIDALVTLTPPGHQGAATVAACAFVGPASRLDADVRLVLVRADGSVSRSPSASGSAAVATVLAAMTVHPPGSSRHESLAGTSWTTEVGGGTAGGPMTVAITGDVVPTGSSEWLEAPDDPLTRGTAWV